MSVRNSILRSIRLQVKSGFLKSEPYAYKFMKRYPPISNDSTISAINISNNSINNKRNSSYGTIDVSKIPYMYLYDKILSDNPIYNDEKVFPGYWQQEPQALVLAKKQYEYIHMNGLSEQEAYEKAIDYINTIENKSYLQLKEFYNILNSNDSTYSTTNNNGEAKRENGTTQENSTNSSNEIKLPFVLDNEIMNELQKWKDILSMKSYDELELADQGELDYFIQTKILKWSEIERERRMKDVLFVKQYNNLLTKLLPIPSIDSYDSTTKTGSNNTNKFKETFYALNKIDQNKLTTNLPFYINDYLHYYQKVLSETNLRKWSAIDRNNFSKWIIDTLALREILDKNSNSVVQKYLDEVRAHFFPMLRYNNMQNSTNGYSIYLNKLPSLNEIRELLYQNDIGYKKLNNKVYVKRYYRLPMLLFPREVLTFRIASDPDLLRLAFSILHYFLVNYLSYFHIS